MSSTSLSQSWLSEVEDTGTLINRKSLSKNLPKSISMISSLLQ